MDLVRPDPGLTQSKPEPIVYRCRKCRRIIAAKSNLITHSRILTTTTTPTTSPMNTCESTQTTTDAIVHCETTDAEKAQNELSKKTNKLCISNTESEKSLDDGPNQRCKEILFIEPIAWMAEICKQTQGKLNCPKCNSKLGNFTWINGCNCPCGKNVAPAFYLVPSKVELSHSVQNVEITV